MEGQINIDRVREASEDIKKSIQRLRLLGKMSLEEFLSDEDSQDIARSRLLVHFLKLAEGLMGNGSFVGYNL
ncbi:MAG: hypothetical protein JRI46_05970 [Deltaproteobacteria bacterium]|nr:hypothetical protein [Deltaproteobacteria bacterium]